MINPNDIKVNHIDELWLPYITVRATLHLGQEACVHKAERVHLAQPPDALDREEQRCKREVWHAIYGDLGPMIDRARREVLTQCDPRSFDAANRAFEELFAMVKDPFVP